MPTVITADSDERKELPIVSGVLDYFPDALLAVASLSKKGNDKHNPGEPLHWARGKSGDEADCLVRHLLERGTLDTDGERHSTKVAWRALANLQKEIEAERGDGRISRGSWPAEPSVVSAAPVVEPYNVSDRYDPAQQIDPRKNW